MNLRIFLILAAILVQLFVYADFAADNYSARSHSAYTEAVYDSISNDQTNMELVCQNFTKENLTISHQRTDNSPIGSSIVLFNNKQFLSLVKYIYDNSGFRQKSSYIAFSSEISTRAP